MQWGHVRKNYNLLSPAVHQARRVAPTVIATLGRIETVRTGAADSLLNHLLRVADRPTQEEGTDEVAFAYRVVA